MLRRVVRSTRPQESESDADGQLQLSLSGARRMSSAMVPKVFNDIFSLSPLAAVTKNLFCFSCEGKGCATAQRLVGQNSD